MATRAELAPAGLLRPTAAPVRAPAIRAADWRTMASIDECFGWDALTLHAAEPNPFFESWYLLACLPALDPPGRVKLLRFEYEGRLAGLLPIAAERRYYGRPIPHLAVWVHENCFLGVPLVAAGQELPFWRALLGWADRNAGAGLFLHLRQLPLDGPLHSALMAVLAEQDRFAAIVRRDERALLSSPLDAEAYFEQGMTGKKRKELRRQHARLGELGELRFERQRGDSELSGWIDQFLALEQAGWKGAAASALASAPATARMFSDALHGAAECGRLERLTLSLDAKPIAMLTNFLTPPGAYSYKTAYDENYARFSPGVLLQRANLDLLDDPEIAWCDSCAAADHPMIDRIWRERRAIGSMSIAIGGTLRRSLFRTLARIETRKDARP